MEKDPQERDSNVLFHDDVPDGVAESVVFSMHDKRAACQIVFTVQR